MPQFPLQITLAFLGQRPYLQGTTLFDALVSYVPRQARLSLKIPHLIKSDCVEVVDATLWGDRARSLAATLSWETEAEKGVLGVKALPCSETPRRIPYDEGQITNQAQFEAGTAEIRTQPTFSFAATLVSLNKAMLLRHLPKETMGQWLFTRLDLVKLPTGWEKIALKLHLVLPGGKHTRTRVDVDGRTVGDLYFYWFDKKLG